ncbi:MAG: nucleotidyltransferase family protein [Desulfobacula sp.]|jgi:predicted nucleotidyltransferase|nr:nucleotidyltransferase family protein [Desulfobacula sp.]
MNKLEIINFLISHKQELREKYGVTRIGLFGSYARDEAKEDSDIDIAVEIESNNKYRSFFGLKRHLEKNLKNKVDLGIESTLKPVAKEYILKEIIYV